MALCTGSPDSRSHITTVSRWLVIPIAAKKLLDEKGAAFTEIDIEKKPEARAEMIQKAGGRSTVPQIFIGEKHVGGCDDLYALDDRGELQRLLAA